MKGRPLLIFLTLFFIWLHINYEKPRQLVPRYNKPNIERMEKNPSIQRYIKDSINRGPFNKPTIYIQLEPLHPRLIGITYKLANNTYLIGLNPLYSHLTLQRTLFHELVHVKQLDRKWIDGDLWMGRKQDWSLPWSSRPWEQQAEAETDLFYKP